MATTTRIPFHPRRHPAAIRVLAAAAALCAAALPARADITDVSGIGGLFDRVLTLQPIQVCSLVDGCAPVTLYQDQLLRTLAQAGIAVAVLPTTTVYAGGLLTGQTSIDPFNARSDGKSSNWQTLNAWYVNTLAPGDKGGTVFGLGYKGGNGMVIAGADVLRTERKDTLPHEIGHNLGLDHDTLGAGTADNLMTEGDLRSSPAMGLTASQKATMRDSDFVAEAPKLTLDFDPREGQLTMVTLRLESAPADVRLRSLTIDLPDWQNLPPPQLPAWYDAVIDAQGGSVLEARIRYTENMVTEWSREGPQQWSSTFGAPELRIDFGVDGMAAGEDLSFLMGVRGNLRGEYEFAIERDLYGADLTLEYDFGLTTVTTVLDAASLTDSRMLRSIGASVASPAPFGRQLLPGELGPVGPIDIDPVSLPVPEPGSALLLLAGGLALAGWRRRA